MTHGYATLIRIVLLLAAGAASVNAQPWNAHTTAGGASYISSLIVHNNVLYAATWGGGIYYSSDYGETWKPMNNGLDNFFIYAAIPVGAALLCGTEGGGVYSCAITDRVWQKSSVGLGDRVVFSLVERNGVILAATWQGGIFRSIDTAMSWEPSSAGLDSSVIYCLGAGGTVFYAGASRNGVYHSIDGGITWRHIGLYGMSILCVYCLDDVALFGTWKNGVFRLVETSGAWERVDGGFGESAKAVAYRARESALYCAKRMLGMYRSFDSGATWHGAGLVGEDVFSAAALPDRIVAGTWGNGIFTLRDDDTAWIPTCHALDDCRRAYPQEQDEEPYTGTGYAGRMTAAGGYAPGAFRERTGLIESRILSARTCIKGKLVLCYTLKDAATVTVNLYNYRGSLLEKISVEVPGTIPQRTVFSTGHLARGVYFITITTAVDRSMVAAVYLE